jgi:hypothetical protein
MEVLMWKVIVAFAACRAEPRRLTSDKVLAFFVTNLSQEPKPKLDE